MLAQFRALKLIQLNDLFIWLDNERQAVHPVSPLAVLLGWSEQEFVLFFWALKHSHASVCLMRQTGSDASGPSVLVKYNLQSSHLPLSSLSISAHWDSGHSNTILTTSSSFSWLLAKICPRSPPLPSLSFRSGQRQGLLWLQVQGMWRTTPFATRKIFRDVIPIFIYKCKICMAVEESAGHHE